MDREVWYRYEDITYGPPLDEWERSVGEGWTKVVLREYVVVRRTPKGVWISMFWGDLRVDDKLRGDEKFVLLSSRKQFACPTKEKALESFVFRKNRQIEIYAYRLRKAKRALMQAKAIELQLIAAKDKADG